MLSLHHLLHRISSLTNHKIILLRSIGAHAYAPPSLFSLPRQHHFDGSVLLMRLVLKVGEAREPRSLGRGGLNRDAAGTVGGGGGDDAGAVRQAVKRRS